MPQHDLNIANADGATFRADLNDALVALGSCQKGPNAPPAPVAGMLWLEDDNPSSNVWTLRIYDGAQWIAIGQINSVGSTFLLGGIILAGSAAAPSLAPTGDTDTGLFAPAANTMAMATNGLERWRLTSAGFVGVGTTTPGGLLQVENALNNSALAQIRVQNANASGGYAEVLLRDVNGAANLRTQVLRCVQGELICATLNDAENAATERWRMNSNGAMRFGNPAHLMRSDEKFSAIGPVGFKASTTNTPSLVVGTLDNTFFGEFYNASTVSIGSITATGGGTGVAFNTTSDARLKSIERPNLNLDPLWAALRPEWVKRLDAPEQPAHWAFLAQRVAEAIPDAVTPGSEAEPGTEGFRPWVMDYSKTTPAIMALLMSLADRVAELEARLARQG